METKREISNSQLEQKNNLIKEVQNLIWALKFEVGPIPGEPNRVPVDFNAGMIFAIGFNLLSTATHPKTYPWQEIKIEHPENQNPSMYEVLKAAKKALEQTDSEILSDAKNSYAGEYDKVQTWFGGKQPSTGGYGYFAKTMGTVTNHPGTLVGDIIGKVEEFFQNLVRNKPEEKVEPKYF